MLEWNLDSDWLSAWRCAREAPVLRGFKLVLSSGCLYFTVVRVAIPGVVHTKTFKSIRSIKVVLMKSPRAEASI